MSVDINKEFDKIIYDLTGKEKTLDKSDKIVYDDIQKKINCNSFDDYIDLYYKNEVSINVSCKCGMDYEVSLEPNEIIWDNVSMPTIESVETIEPKNFYCLNCGISIFITGGEIKDIKIKEFKRNNK